MWLLSHPLSVSIELFLIFLLFKVVIYAWGRGGVYTIIVTRYAENRKKYLCAYGKKNQTFSGINYASA